MKILLKIIHWSYRKLSSFLAAIIALPFVILGLVSHSLKGEITEPSLVLSRIPFHIGEKARLFYYKLILSSVGREVTFSYGTFCQYRSTRIGNRVLIGYFNVIGEACIGDNVLIGGNVNLLSGLHQHSFDDPGKFIWDTPAKGRRMINIGSDVWIGSNTVIGNDVGDRCVVAAGSVVVKEVEPHSLVGGNPAKLLKRI